MVIKKCPVINFNDLETSENSLEYYLKEFGVIAINESEAFQEKTSYFESLKTLFDQMLCYNTPQSFPLLEDCYCIYLPTGVENIAKTQEDCKAVLDVFPRESYSYQYYLERGLLETKNLEFDWNDYQKLLSWNQKYLQFLSTVSSQLVDNILLPDEVKKNWLIRLIYYPPVPNAEFLRLAEHIDDDLLTIVIAEDLSSLEIKNQNDSFQKINVPQTSFLLFGGNCLEHITNGQIKALPHRVVGGDFYLNSRYIINLNLGANLERDSIKSYYENILKNKYFLNKS